MGRALHGSGEKVPEEMCTIPCRECLLYRGEKNG
jgi:hypothetical protein